jgi:hypothetical protein
MPKRPEDDRPGPERDALDREHSSDHRGEHRYPDAGQTPAERSSRRDRDDLKRRLAGAASEAAPHDSRYRAEPGDRVEPDEHTRARPSVIDDLRDLISALDRRTPQLERKGETDIALVAAALRAEAVQRIAELDGTAAARAARTPQEKSAARTPQEK